MSHTGNANEYQGPKEDATKKQDEKKIHIQPRLQHEVITNIRPRDVLPGANNSSHPGNVYFTDLLKKHELKYTNSAKRDRAGIARAIVDEIIKKNGDHPPGRFLKEVDEATSKGQWYDMGYDKAFKKTRQALCQRASILRKATLFSERISNDDSGADTDEGIGTHSRHKRRSAFDSTDRVRDTVDVNNHDNGHKNKRRATGDIYEEGRHGDVQVKVEQVEKLMDDSESSFHPSASETDEGIGTHSTNKRRSAFDSTDRVRDTDDGNNNDNGHKNKRRATGDIYEEGRHDDVQVEVDQQEDEVEKLMDDSISSAPEHGKETSQENEQVDELERNQSDGEENAEEENQIVVAEEYHDDEGEIEDEAVMEGVEEEEANIEREEAKLKLENTRLKLLIDKHDALSKYVTQINEDLTSCNDSGMRWTLKQRARHETLTGMISQANSELNSCKDEEMKEILRTSILDMMRQRAGLAKNL